MLSLSNQNKTITVRQPWDIYKAKGRIENGTFTGRWHFSFGEYNNPQYTQFGLLRVLNDDTLSPGAVWPLHPHHNIEVVTYCAAGQFRHADERGNGGILKKGWVQHTTVGSGMFHSEINDRKDLPMRFIQMWFVPSQPDLKPSVEQTQVAKFDRTDKLLLLVSNKNPAVLKIFSDVEVYSCFLRKDMLASHTLQPGRGAYLYVLEGGPVLINDNLILRLGAAVITDEKRFVLYATNDAELLLIDTAL